MGNRFLALLWCAAVLGFFIGCGSLNDSNSSTLGTKTPSGGNVAVQYEAATDANIGTGSSSTGVITGQITINTAGNGAMDIQGPVPNANFKVTWCNFPGTTGCFDIGSFNADSGGELKASFTFPQHGRFAGVFGFTEEGVNVFNAGFDIPNGSTPFRAVMLPAASITAGLGAFATELGVGNDLLSSGLVSVASGSSTAHIVLQGIPANQSYNVLFCSNGAVSSGSGCLQSNNFSSDGSGNATVDMAAGSTGRGVAGVFLVRRMMGMRAPIEFVSGFRVP